MFKVLLLMRFTEATRGIWPYWENAEWAERTTQKKRRRFTPQQILRRIREDRKLLDQGKED